MGTGFNQGNPLDESELKYTYENHQDFAVFPTYNTQMVGVNLLDALVGCPVMPRDFNPLLLLHAEQRVELYDDTLKPNTEYVSKFTIDDVVDKKKIYTMLLKLETFEKQTKKLAFINYINFFIRQPGG